jgi:hypothetical protein
LALYGMQSCYTVAVGQDRWKIILTINAKI